MSYRARLMGSMYLLAVAIEFVLSPFLGNVSVKFGASLIEAALRQHSGVLICIAASFVGVTGGVLILLSPVIAAILFQVLTAKKVG